jgi:hypothetical protein
MPGLKYQKRVGGGPWELDEDAYLSFVSSLLKVVADSPDVLLFDKLSLLPSPKVIRKLKKANGTDGGSLPNKRLTFDGPAGNPTEVDADNTKITVHYDDEKQPRFGGNNETARACFNINLPNTKPAEDLQYLREYIKKIYLLVVAKMDAAGVPPNQREQQLPSHLDWLDDAGQFAFGMMLLTRCR